MTAGMFIAAVGRPANAQQRCDGVRLDLADDLSPAWREAGIRLRSELVGSEAPCVSATLFVENAPNGSARLSATTPDGRHTERLLTKVSALVPTALGIVASLPPDPPRVSPATPSVKFEPAPPTTSDDAALERSAPITHGGAAPKAWIGASAGGRIAAPAWLGMLTLEGDLQIETNHWLFAGSIRFGSSLGESAVSTDDSYEEIVGSLGAGRRFQFGASSLDVLVSPEISSSSLDDNDDENGPPGAARTELRVGAAATWWTTFGDDSRIGVSADTDVAPYGIFHGVRSSMSEPPVPAWTGAVQVRVAGRLL